MTNVNPIDLKKLLVNMTNSYAEKLYREMLELEAERPIGSSHDK